MSSSVTGKTKLICFSLLFQLPFSTVSGTSTASCSSSDPDFDYSGSQCASEYTDLINPHRSETEIGDVLSFWRYLHDLPDATYNWYTLWEAQKQSPDISHCNAIQPIPDSEIQSTNCLCQLNYVCDDICDDQIQAIWAETAGVLIPEDPYKIPYEWGATTADCTRVLSKISSYQKLCGDTDIYRVIAQCANGTPNPATPPVAQSTPLPTTTTTTATATTLDNASSSSSTTTSTTTSSTTEPPVASTPSPTASNPPDTTSIDSDQSTTTEKPTPSPTESETGSDKPTEAPSTSNPTTSTTASNDSEWNYDDYYAPYQAPFGNQSQLDTQESFGEPSTTQNELLQYQDSHPFANLLLVSLIILGFCVFVAWYAKKNQITSDEGMGREDDNGYLWGLNKSSPSAEHTMMGGAGGMNDGKRGRMRHKKLSDFDEQTLDQRMNIQMTMNQHNDDLLAITPDHVGRLQTRAHAPNDIHAKPMKKAKIKRTKRRGRGGAFEQLNDDDEQNDDAFEGSSSDSEDGVDMMKMRDQYYASQTFSKKLADTLGDIHDTVKVTAAAVKTKLSKKEQTVVVPMQIKATKKEKRGDKKKKKYPFTIVEDNETTDGFDLSEDDSSDSTQEMEYREDPVSEVRMNIHGRKIKQVMGLPTFNEEEEEVLEADAQVTVTAPVATAAPAVVVANSGNTVAHHEVHKRDKKKKERHHHKKKKKDKKKRKKKEKKKAQMEDDRDKEVRREEAEDQAMDKVNVESESHDINITINNEDNMGFGTDELNEEHIEELTKEEEVMTMNDLQMELMKHNTDIDIKKEDDSNNNKSNNNNKKNVDLSFMDDMVDALKENLNNEEEDHNTNNNNAVSSGNGLMGNGSGGVEATQS